MQFVSELLQALAVRFAETVVVQQPEAQSVLNVQPQAQAEPKQYVLYAPQLLFSH
jgi:hypothetical protein